jgi:NAD(P)-dependent dehydrogenase (short-subunit alcohol dehydrogenase family)
MSSTKVVLITGCSSGIGRALANEYLLLNYQVYASARNLSSIDGWHNKNLHKVTLDVNDTHSIELVIREIKEKHGYLNCLINNAGYAAMGAMLDINKEQLLAQFETNVFAPLQITQAASDLLVIAGKHSSSQVVNIGSVSGITTTPFSGAYCASKSAIHNISDALRMELSPFNIDVICVQPGAIRSQFGANSSANLQDPSTHNSRYKSIKHAIEARARASQDNPTTAEDFARTIVKKLQRKPKAVLRAGNGSIGLPLLKHCLPTAWLDGILKKKFSLNKPL